VRLILGDIVVRQPGTRSSYKIDMSRDVRPYTSLSCVRLKGPGLSIIVLAQHDPRSQGGVQKGVGLPWVCLG
jgi:hypothetical protein